MMQKYGFSMTDKGTTAVPSDVGGFYLASEVDARIAELVKALQEIVRTAATIPGSDCGGMMHAYAAQYRVSARAVEAARELMER